MNGGLGARQRGFLLGMEACDRVVALGPRSHSIFVTLEMRGLVRQCGGVWSLTAAGRKEKGRIAATWEARRGSGASSTGDLVVVV